MRRLFRSALALIALGSSLMGCNRSGDSGVPAGPGASGNRSSARPEGAQSQVTLYVPGIT
jgi:hypothetical protein